MNTLPVVVETATQKGVVADEFEFKKIQDDANQKKQAERQEKVEAAEAEKARLEVVLTQCTQRFKDGIGKSVAGIFDVAEAIGIAYAQTTLNYKLYDGRNRYNTWLKETCKISDQTAGKYLTIYKAREIFTEEYRLKCPPSFTTINQLSRLNKTQLKKVMKDVTPGTSYEDVTKWVNEELGKTIHRVSKEQKTAILQGLRTDGKEAAGVPDSVTGALVTRPAMAPLNSVEEHFQTAFDKLKEKQWKVDVPKDLLNGQDGQDDYSAFDVAAEPTPTAIAEVQDTDDPYPYEFDNVEVDCAAMNDALLKAKAEHIIRTALHAAGIFGLKVTVEDLAVKVTVA